MLSAWWGEWGRERLWSEDELNTAGRPAWGWLTLSPESCEQVRVELGEEGPGARAAPKPSLRQEVQPLSQPWDLGDVPEMVRAQASD